MKPSALRCKECCESYPLDARYVCEACFGPLEVDYDYDAIPRAPHLRRRSRAGRRTCGDTASCCRSTARRPSALARRRHPARPGRPARRGLGLDTVWVKNDTVNPTFSFKDRVVSVALAARQELGFETLACASTGNLADAVAAHAAAPACEAYVFIPADLERARSSATGVYAPTWCRRRQLRRRQPRLQRDPAEYHWAFVNINMRPYYSEGSKTLAYEVAEQLGWRLPRTRWWPIASGSLFTKVWKGFQELIEAGPRRRRAAEDDRRPGRWAARRS